MTGALLLAICLQVPIETHIDAFLKGDTAARAELMKLGVHAIRPLQRAGGLNPGAIDKLVYDLKVAAAHPKSPEIVAALEWPVSFVSGEISADWIGGQARNLGIPAFLDQIDTSRLKKQKLKVGGEKEAPKRAILDDLCRQAGLDWGLFHNHVVIGHPDRLWPSGPIVKVVELDEKALARAKELVEKLADESIDVREAATRDLAAMGPAVIKVLESNGARKEREIASRCATLVENLRVTLKGTFGPSGADRQQLSGDDEKLLGRLRSFKATVSFKKETIREIAAHFGRIDSIPIDVDAAVPDAPITVSMKAQHVHDILALITQSHGLDFTIRSGRIRIEVAR